MKIQQIKIVIIMLIGFLTYEGWAVTTQADHLEIADKFRFYYIDNITSTSAYLVDNAAVRGGTESGTFWSNASMSGFHQYLRALLKEPSNGGDRSLQYYTTKLVKINNRPIVVILWNDTTAFSRSDVALSNKPCQDSSQFVWPCASHWTTSQNADWGGYMHLGIHHTTSKGLTWLKNTFLHELMHTQDATMQLGNSFIVFGESYRYGADGSHFFTEATPNKRLAYMEAIANVAPMYYNFSDFQRWFTWFTNNDNILVERTAPPNWVRTLGQLFGAGYNDNVWLYDQIRNHPNGGVGTPHPVHTTYNQFRIQSLPSEFIVHNEIIMAMMMTMTSLHIAEMDPFIWATKTFNTRITANQNQDPYALFVKIFAEGMLQNGQTIAQVKRNLEDRLYSISPEDDIPYAFILPLAYSDYFTAYSSTSKTEFKALFNNEMDNDLIDIYWDYFKDRVRTNVTIQAGRTWSDMTEIAMQCGVNQSYLPGTSGRSYDRN